MISSAGVAEMGAAAAPSEGMFYAAAGAERAASNGDKKYVKANYRQLVRMMRVFPELNPGVGGGIPRNAQHLMSYFEWLASSEPTSIPLKGQERRPVKGETVKTFVITVKSVCVYMLANWGTDAVKKLNRNNYSKEMLETIVAVCINM